MTQAIDETDDCGPDETVKDYYNRIFGKYKRESNLFATSIRKIEDKWKMILTIHFEKGLKHLTKVLRHHTQGRSIATSRQDLNARRYRAMAR